MAAVSSMDSLECAMGFGVVITDIVFGESFRRADPEVIDMGRTEPTAYNMLRRNTSGS
jgi:hypothetical protein